MRSGFAFFYCAAALKEKIFYSVLIRVLHSQAATLEKIRVEIKSPVCVALGIQPLLKECLC